MTASSRSDEIRRNVIAAVVVFGAITIGAIVVVLAPGSDEKGPGAPTTSLVVGPDGSTVPVVDQPSSLPKPDSGRAPEDSGDPGGWEQTLIFVLVVLAMGGLGLALARGTRRTRAAKQRWIDAAQPGREEERTEARKDEIERVHSRAAPADGPLSERG